MPIFNWRQCRIFPFFIRRVYITFFNQYKSVIQSRKMCAVKNISKTGEIKWLHMKTVPPLVIPSIIYLSYLKYTFYFFIDAI